MRSPSWSHGGDAGDRHGQGVRGAPVNAVIAPRRRRRRWRSADDTARCMTAVGADRRRRRRRRWRWRNRFCGARRGVLHPAAAAAAARAVLGRAQRAPAPATWPGVDRLAATTRRPCRCWPATRSLPGTRPLAAVYSRPPVRRLGRPARRRPRAAAGRDRHARRADGAAAQGLRPDALLAHGRRPRGAALVDPRVPLLRGDARARHSDHARAGASIGSPLPVRRETIETAAVVMRVAPSFVRFGHFEYFAHTAQRPTRCSALADYVIDALLSRHAATRAEPYAALLEEVTRAHRAADGAVAGGGLLPRRDEHRQHVDPRPDDRLRPVRLPRRLRPGHICNHSRRRRAATPMRASPTSASGTCTRWRRRWCR